MGQYLLGIKIDMVVLRYEMSWHHGTSYASTEREKERVSLWG